MLNVFNKLSLKYKLLSFITLVILISITTITVISFIQSKKSLTNQAINQLSSQGQTISNSLESFLDRTKNFTMRLSTDRLIEGMLIAYESSFYGSNFDPGTDLNIYNDFYAKLDKTYGDRKAKMVTEFGFLDVLIVNPDAQVIFTANNEQKDFYLGKNLTNGVYKDSKLAKCYSQAEAAEENSLFFSGFEYNKVSDSHVAFLCTKKFAEFANADEGIDKGDAIGVVVTQVNTNIITKMMTARTGMGETGQSYLVGQDKLLRSDFFVQQENFNAKKSLKEKITIETKPVELGIEGKDGTMFNQNAYNDEVLSFYKPVKFMNASWIVISEKSSSEIFESIQSMVIFIISSSIGLFVLIFTLAIFATNNIISPIIQSKDSLNEISGTLGHGAENLKSNSMVLSKGSNEIAQNIQDTVSTMTEITQMVNQNLDNIKQTTTNSNEMLRSANSGKQSLQDMTLAMEEISKNNEFVIETMNNVNQHISEFNNVINEVAEKTNVINDIVSQTKLLSFNASVEAARAGEQGKGFAVVAEEIGNLASASGAAAMEIGTLLEGNVQRVEQMVKDTNQKIDEVKTNGIKKITQGRETTKSCEVAITDILEKINLMNEKVGEINSASNEQAKGISDINTAMANLQKNTDQSTNIASEALDLSDNIQGDSGKLTEIFKNLDALITGK